MGKIVLLFFHQRYAMMPVNFNTYITMYSNEWYAIYALNLHVR